MTTTISDRIEESRAGLKRIKETSVRLRDCLRVRHAQLPEHLQTRLSPLVDAAPETPAKPVALAFDGSPASVLDASAFLGWRRTRACIQTRRTPCPRVACGRGPRAARRPLWRHRRGCRRRVA